MSTSPNFGAEPVITTGNIQVGATPAGSGLVRLSNNGSVVFRNAADSADVSVVNVDGSNNVVFGDASSASGLSYNAGSGNIHVFRIGGSDQISLGSGFIQVGGSSTASTGSIRGQTDFSIKARNDADTIDLDVITLFSGNDNLTVGQDTVITTLQHRASGRIDLITGGNTQVFINDADGFQVNNNIKFRQTVSSPQLVQKDTGSGNGQTLTIQAQGSTDTGSTGGNLNITSGSGTSANGQLQLGTPAGTVFTVRDSAAAFGNNVVEIGSNPSTTGLIRLGNAANIFARNSGDTGDFQVIDISTNDIVIGSGGNSGALNLQAGGNVDVLSVSGSINVDALGGPINIEADGGDVILHASTVSDNIKFQINSTNVATVNDGYFAVSGSDVETVAQSGVVRLSNTDSITWRNAADTGDVRAIQIDGSDNLKLGDNNTNTTSFQTSNLWEFLDSSGGQTLSIFDNGITQISGSSSLLAITSGGSVATSGTIRLENNAGITWRDNAGSANIQALRINTSDNLVVGANVDINSNVVFNVSELRSDSTPASTGKIRLGNNESIKARNAGDTADALLISLNGIDDISIGDSTNVDDVIVDFDNRLLVRPDGSEEFRVSASGTSITTQLSIGGSPASAGAIRLQNNELINARNNANTADINLIGTNIEDNVVIGGPNNTQIEHNTNGNQIFRAGGVIEFAVKGGWIEATGGGSPVAGSGVVRLPSSGAIKYRNAANTADISFGTVSIDQVVLGDTAGNAERVVIVDDTRIENRIAGNDELNIKPGFIEITGGGNSVAASGTIRLNSSGQISARNSGNTADIDLIKTSGSNDNVTVGQDTGVGTLQHRASGRIDLITGGNTQVFINDADGLQVDNNIKFRQTVSSPQLVQKDTGSGNGQTLTIQAQGSTDTGSTGGNLNITSGSGTSANGQLQLGTPAGTVFTVRDSAAAFGNNVVEIGSNPSTTGLIRLGNAANIFARNGGDTANFQVIDISGNDIVIGSGGNSGALNLESGGNVDVLSTGGAVNINIGANNEFNIESGFVEVTGGGNPVAASGDIRLRNGTSITARNNIDSADLTLLSSISSDRVQLGGGNVTEAVININSSDITTIDENKIFIADTAAAPTTDPTAGGYLYVESGALKYRGSAGTITEIAAA